MERLLYVPEKLLVIIVHYRCNTHEKSCVVLIYFKLDSGENIQNISCHHHSATNFNLTFQ